VQELQQNADFNLAAMREYNWCVTFDIAQYDTKDCACCLLLVFTRGQLVASFLRCPLTRGLPQAPELEARDDSR
jgi:hypothetical protein